MRSGELTHFARSAAIMETASARRPARSDAMGRSQSGLCAGPERSPPLLCAISARKSAMVLKMRGTRRGSQEVARASRRARASSLSTPKLTILRMIPRTQTSSPLRSTSSILASATSRLRRWRHSNDVHGLQYVRMSLRLMRSHARQRFTDSMFTCVMSCSQSATSSSSSPGVSTGNSFADQSERSSPSGQTRFSESPDTSKKRSQDCPQTVACGVPSCALMESWME